MDQVIPQEFYLLARNIHVFIITFFFNIIDITYFGNIKNKCFMQSQNNYSFFFAT